MAVEKRIAIVILSWNGEKLFHKFLPSVILNSKLNNVKIIIADNGSTDNSVSYLENNFPEIRLIKLSRNYGFAEGYNQALKQVDADYFVILNSDVEVTENWIEPCLKQFESDKKVAAIQPKILSYSQKNLFEYAGAAGGYIDKYGYPFCRGRILNQIEADLEQYNYDAPIFWASGACMFIRAKCI